jgi:hypothetical protein
MLNPCSRAARRCLNGDVVMDATVVHIPPSNAVYPHQRPVDRGVDLSAVEFIDTRSCDDIRPANGRAASLARTNPYP